MATQLKPLPATPGSVNPHKRGLKAILSHQNFRRLSQLGFAVFIIILVVRHILIGEDGPVVTASAEAYCPFGGLKTLYKYITAGGSFVSHTHLSNVVFLIVTLAVAFLFRSAFCGWICPLGFLQDLVSNFSKFLQKRIPGLRHAFASFKKRMVRLAMLDRYLRYVKYLVLAWAVGGSAYFGHVVFRNYDPWFPLLNSVEFSFNPVFIVLMNTLVASIFIERPWCLYTCPLGVISGLVSKLSPVYLKKEESACTICKVCTKSCPTGIEIHNATTINSVDCITCLECIGACRRNGGLEIKIRFLFIEK